MMIQHLKKLTVEVIQHHDLQDVGLCSFPELILFLETFSLVSQLFSY